MNRKPAAIIDPIETSHLFNPFNKDAFLETLNLPVFTELNLIGQGNPWTIESGIHTQSVIDRTSEVIQSDIMTRNGHIRTTGRFKVSKKASLLNGLKR